MITHPHLYLVVLVQEKNVFLMEVNLMRTLYHQLLHRLSLVHCHQLKLVTYHVVLVIVGHHLSVHCICLSIPFVCPLHLSVHCICLSIYLLLSSFLFDHSSIIYVLINPSVHFNIYLSVG